MNVISSNVVRVAEAAASSDALSTSLSQRLPFSVAGDVRVVGAVWMLSSAILTTFSTTKYLKYNGKDQGPSLFKHFNRPRPTLLTVSRFGGSLLLGLLLHPNLRILERFRDSMHALPDFFLPAVFLFIANYSNTVSLNRIGISLTYTSKCGIPLITVLLTLLIEGRQAMPSTAALASLIPIALGIASASWNSPTFEKLGFLAAMISCTAQSLLNVTSKRAISKTCITGSEAQRAMVAVAFVISIMFSLVQSKHSEASKDGIVHSPDWLLGMAVASYHVEYVSSFMFVKLVNPITYGACDAIRRLGIIVSGRCMFGGAPFTRLNLLGIALSLLGALLYTIASNR